VIIKKRTSKHEDTIREYMIDGRGLTLGEPLTNFHGVLRGVPTLVDGAAATLLKGQKE
jgi:circadian clock protein KaiC